MKARGTPLFIRVNEIFSSIDGEGVRAGELTTFIRLPGCNLNCNYCDTSYARHGLDGEKWPLYSVLKKVAQIGNHNITVTGGEPLISQNVGILIHRLCRLGHSVNIETNGSRPIDNYTDYNNAIITMDYKLMSSGAGGKMLLGNLEQLREQDVLKFVLRKEDFQEIEEILSTFAIKSYIYLSPVFGDIEPALIVEFMQRLQKLGHNTSKMRVQLQLHKYIWDPEARGV